MGGGGGSVHFDIRESYKDNQVVQPRLHHIMCAADGFREGAKSAEASTVTSDGRYVRPSLGSV